MNTVPKTIFCDIDGSILEQHGDLSNMHLLTEEDLLPGVKKANARWTRKGYTVIVTTGRKESERELTVRQLKLVGFHYDLLIMGLPYGERVVINDRRAADNKNSATGINLVRNEGMEDLEV